MRYAWKRSELVYEILLYEAVQAPQKRVQSFLRTECLVFHRDQVIKGQAYGYLRHPERSSPGYLFVDPTIASHQV